MSHIFRSSLIIGISFGLNKLLALGRQYAIAARFGFTPEIDAFNVANNLPDLVFSLFSGGALAMAFIPVFAEYLNVHGQDLSWKLFSKVTTIICTITLVASIAIAAAAPLLVSSQIGVAPGFNPSQQALVVVLLRINLIATIVFSISGLVTASLQAHKHFLLPALAPLFYNLGIIIGALVFAPVYGIYGLTWGVVLGAFLHLAVQLPALKHFKFQFSLSWDTKDAGMRKILRLMWPRVLTVLLINITFLLRDNLASRLAPGSVTALTYGYFIMQVPETLIGSSLATALLPTLAVLVTQKRQQEFAQAISAAIRVLIAASVIPIALSLATLTPLITLVFDFSPQETQLLAATTNAFMAGLVAQVLLEVFVRAYYAQQKPMIPLVTTLLRTIVFVVLGIIFYARAGAVGIAAIDSVSVALQVGVLFALLMPLMREPKKIIKTAGRSIIGGALAFGVTWTALLPLNIPQLVQLGIALLLGTGVYALFVTKEARVLLKM